MDFVIIQKGKSVIEFKKDYTVVDIQITGLDPWRCEIIELGAIKYRDNVEKGRFQTLCNPKKPIDSFVQELTGITNDMLSGQPCVEDVIEGYLDFIGSDLIVGSTIGIKMNFIINALRKKGHLGLSNNFVDVSRIARKYFEKLDSWTVEAICRKCGFAIDEKVFHRAVCDCEHIHGIYDYFFNKIVDKDAFLLRFKKKKIYDPSKALNSKNIKAESDLLFDEDSPLYERTFCFTGKLDKMNRREAMQRVVDVGGKITNSVTKKTNFLVVGDLDFSKLANGEKSSKMIKAEKYKLGGNDIEIISEDVFYEMLKE